MDSVFPFAILLYYCAVLFAQGDKAFVASVLVYVNPSQPLLTVCLLAWLCRFVLSAYMRTLA